MYSASPFVCYVPETFDNSINNFAEWKRPIRFYWITWIHFPGGRGETISRCFPASEWIMFSTKGLHYFRSAQVRRGRYFLIYNENISIVLKTQWATRTLLSLNFYILLIGYLVSFRSRNGRFPIVLLFRSKISGCVNTAFTNVIGSSGGNFSNWRLWTEIKY